MASRGSKRKKRKRKKAAFTSLIKKTKERFPDENFVVQPGGEEKISEVLMEFIEPYIKSLKTDEEHKKLITLAIVAWNTALLPEEEQQEMVDEALSKAVPPDTRTPLKRIMNQLIERKKKYFSDNKRFILGYELSRSGESLSLSVASTLSP